jgi:hypothetical protein
MLLVFCKVKSGPKLQLSDEKDVEVLFLEAMLLAYILYRSFSLFFCRFTLYVNDKILIALEIL